MRGVISFSSTRERWTAGLLLWFAAIVSLSGCAESPDATPQTSSPIQEISGPQSAGPLADVSEVERAFAVLEIESASGERTFQHATCVDPEGLFLSVSRDPVSVEKAKKLRLHLIPSSKTGEVTDAEVVNCRLGYVICVQAAKKGPYDFITLGEMKDPQSPVDVEEFYANMRLDRFDRAAYERPRRVKDRVRSSALGKEPLGVRFVVGRGPGFAMPVLNSQGQLVGLGTGSPQNPTFNACASTEAMRQWLSTPQVSLATSSFAAEHLAEPQSINILVRADEATRAKATVELEILASHRKPQRFEAKAQRNIKIDGVRLLPKGDGASQRIRAEYDGAMVEGSARDAKVPFGDRELLLSQIARYDSLEGVAQLKSGEKIKGSLRKSEPVEINFGNVTAPISLDLATRFEVTALEADVPAIRYRLRLTADGKTAAETVGDLSIRASAETAAESATSILPTIEFAPELSVPVVQEKLRPAFALPSVLGRVMPAGKGRYLLLYFPRLRIISIFDVASLELTHSVTTDSDDFLFFGSADQVVIIDRAKSEIRAYDLQSGALRNRAAYPPQIVIREAQAGICSPGPALAITSGNHELGIRPIDLKSLEILPPLRYRNEREQLHYEPFKFLRVSGDGKYFVYSHSLGYKDMASMGFVEDDSSLTLSTNKAWGRQTISFSGPMTFGVSGESEFGRPTHYRGDRSQGHFDQDGGPFQHWFRTYHEALILKLTRSRDWELSLNTLHDFNPIGVRTPPDALMETISGVRQFSESNLLPDERVHCYPEMNLLITIPPTSDELRIEEFDWRGQLRKNNGRYFVVTSAPHPRAHRGKTYRYPMRALSSEESLVYSLYSNGGVGSVGPIAPGTDRSVSPSGEFVWEVPTNAQLGEVSHSIQVTAPDGHRFHYQFSMEVVD